MISADLSSSEADTGVRYAEGPGQVRVGGGGLKVAHGVGVSQVGGGAY